MSSVSWCDIHGHHSDAMCRGCLRNAARQTNEIEKQAARYRWLRDNCIAKVPASRDGPDYKKLTYTGPIHDDWRFALDHMTLDEAIDAEIAKGK